MVKLVAGALVLAATVIAAVAMRFAEKVVSATHAGGRS